MGKRRVSPKSAPVNEAVALVWRPGGMERRCLEEVTAVRERSRPYAASLGLAERDTKDLVAALRRGLPVSAFESLRAQMGVSAKDLAQSASIAVRTLARRKQGGRLQKGESERLLRIAVLFDRAVEVLESREEAQQWFRTPKRALGGSTPLDFADTEPGAREVEDLLGRIEHGVFS